MWPVRANQYPPYWMIQHDSAGAVSGNHGPLPLDNPLHRLHLASPDGQCPHFSLCVVAVVTPWQPRGMLRAGSFANRRASQPMKATPELRSFASQ